MTQYRLYRHPVRGVEAVDGNHWLAVLLGREDRLIRQGYHYTGSVEAQDGAAALDKARVAARPAAGPPRAQPAAGPQPADAGLRAGAALAGLLLALAAGYDWLHEDDAGPLPAETGTPAPLKADAPAAPAQNESATAESEGFGPWMPYDRTRDYAAGLSERRLRISAVEARAAEGGQCRLRTEAAPARRHWWYWWCAQPREKFEQLDAQYRRAGYTQVQQQSYTDLEGRQWLSGVWHKEAQ